VAIAVANAVLFQVLAPIEHLFKELVLSPETGNNVSVSKTTEIAVVMCMCFIMSIPASNGRS